MGEGGGVGGEYVGEGEGGAGLVGGGEGVGKGVLYLAPPFPGGLQVQFILVVAQPNYCP